MEKGSIGEMTGVFSLGNARMTEGLKARSMSCKWITLIHYIMSSMMKKKKR